MADPIDFKVGAVVIGRNEGNHLRACLESVSPQTRRTIYVDSGSTDESASLARTMGAEVIDLDQSTAFTPARARNAGWQRLLEIESIEFVQFVDGDCLLQPNWIGHAAGEFANNDDLAVVFGHVRELEPDRNIYHRLAVMEWDTPLGIVAACGGIALIRTAALKQAGGYRNSLIAGEEPELCLRLRAAGWKVKKIDVEMALHDSDLTSFAQWWQRTIRAGRAYAEVSALHRTSPLRIWARESRSIWTWGLIVPLAALVLAWPTHGISIAVAVLLYIVLFAKIAWRNCRKANMRPRASALYAAMCVLSKFPQALGQLKYWTNT